MEFLGELVWWSVGTPEIRDAEVRELLTDVGADLPAPKSIVPGDAFRRLTGGSTDSYLLRDPRGGAPYEVTLNLHAASTGQKTMMTRHIVRTVRRLGVTQKADKVGECVFYKPPKNQPSHARIRITVHPDGLPDKDQIERFADDLKGEYQRALKYLDAQAVRRLVRLFLNTQHALYLGGPYFLPHEESAAKFVELITRIGGGSVCQSIPVVDTDRTRQMISDHLADMVERGEASRTLIEAYVPLGTIPEAAWALLDKEGPR